MSTNIVHKARFLLRDDPAKLPLKTIKCDGSEIHFETVSMGWKKVNCTTCLQTRYAPKTLPSYARSRKRHTEKILRVSRRG